MVNYGPCLLCVDVPRRGEKSHISELDLNLKICGFKCSFEPSWRRIQVFRFEILSPVPWYPVTPLVKQKKRNHPRIKLPFKPERTSRLDNLYFERRFGDIGDTFVLKETKKAEDETHNPSF
jgi:hypothetical protein